MNILNIILAALAAFLIGGLWYGPLFGTAWMRLAGRSKHDGGWADLYKVYGLAFLFALLQATMLAHLFARIGQPPFPIVMMISTGIALGFIIPAIGTNYLYRREPAKLFFIDAGYWLVFYAAMGLVFALLG